MSNVVITIALDTERIGHRFEVRPEREDVDPAVLGDRVTWALLESAICVMSTAGLAKWQIAENFQAFVDRRPTWPSRSA